MFGSEVLEVAAGMTLLFLLVSLMCSAIAEALEWGLKLRAMYVERGIRELFQDQAGTGVTSTLYAHPLINSLFSGQYDPARIGGGGKYRWRGRRTLPSYIPARSFATAVLDIASEGKSENVESLRRALAEHPDTHLSRTVLACVNQAEGSLEAVRLNLQSWFDGTMDRVSGWYKRRTQLTLFVIGLGMAIALNIDGLTVAQSLVRDEALRAVVVAQAEASVGRGEGGSEADFERLQGRLNAIGYPLGWKDGWPGPQEAALRCDGGEGCPGGVRPAAALQMVAGWLMTAFAVTFGAPFWFDILNKVMVIRSTVKPREKSPDESSEDRQKTATAKGAS